MNGVNLFNFLNKKIKNLKATIIQKETQLNPKNDYLTKNNFEFQYVIGKGGFGKVSFNNKYLLFKKRNRFGKLNVKKIINIML